MITQVDFNMVCWLWIAVAAIVFPILLNVTQPYGKHSKSNWGPMTGNRLGWFLMELPALLVFGYFLNYNAQPFNLLVLTSVLLWGMHYTHRVFIYPFQIRTSGKKMPVIIVLFAIFFNAINGFLNGYWLAHFAPEYDPGLFIDARIAAGTILFLTGFYINKFHDRILIRLRTSSVAGYRIPFGGLFTYVSCPNFLGELISWTGFFLVTLSLPALSFLVWSFVNLTARALDHHKWYQREFADYPKERKAIFPHLL